VYSKIFSVGLIALGLVFSGFSPFQESAESPKTSDTVQLLSTSVEAEFVADSIHVNWNTLALGHSLSITTDQGTKVFFNSEGLLRDFSPTFGKNFIEVTESTPRAGENPDSNFEEFMTRVLILDLNPNQKNLGLDSAIAATLSPTSTRLRYQTFIREKYLEQNMVSQCIPWPIKAAFGGDNRGFDPDSESYRTRFDVRIDWVNAAIQDYRYVGSSSYFTWDDRITGVDKWKWEKTMFQNTDGIELTPILSSTTLAHFRMQHNVADPFCVIVAPIVYDLDVYIARSGKYTISGFRNTVPVHEVYIRTNVNPDWTVIYQRYKYSYGCLGLEAWRPECYANPDLKSIEF